MNAPLQARRANLEDMDALRQLWRSARLPSESLERQLTNFHVVEEPGGRLIGSAALQISGKEARLYAETFANDAPSSQARALLWNRIQILARNHDLRRIWTLESDPFWSEQGFQTPDADCLAKKPGDWPDHPAWRVRVLRDPGSPALALEKEFEIFMQSERDRSAQAMRQAQWLRYLAWLILAGLMGFLAFFGLKALRNLRALRRRRP